MGSSASNIKKTEKGENTKHERRNTHAEPTHSEVNGTKPAKQSAESYKAGTVDEEEGNNKEDQRTGNANECPSESEENPDENNSIKDDNDEADGMQATKKRTKKGDPRNREGKGPKIAEHSAKSNKAGTIDEDEGNSREIQKTGNTKAVNAEQPGTERSMANTSKTKLNEPGTTTAVFEVMNPEKQPYHEKEVNQTPVSDVGQKSSDKQDETESEYKAARVEVNSIREKDIKDPGHGESNPPYQNTTTNTGRTEPATTSSKNHTHSQITVPDSNTELASLSKNAPATPRYDDGKTKPTPPKMQQGSKTIEPPGSCKGKPHTDVFKHKHPPATISSQNFDFYRNKIKSKPRPGHTIEDMLKWKGDYRQLEINHRYIQWLFPIPESGGMNPDAQPLHGHEIVALRESRDCRTRFLKAYEMMLDFYGIKLVCHATGDVGRCEKNWRQRFAHLNKSGHNYLRITRILKALACFGLRNYQKPWILFFLNEIFVTRALSEIRHGAVIHWIDSMDDENDSQECLRLFQDLYDNTRGIAQSKLHTVEELDSDSDEVKIKLSEQYRYMLKDQGQVADETSDEDESDVQSQTQLVNKKAREKRRKVQIQNLEFYRNNLKSKPEPGYKIDKLLKWKGNYAKWEGQCFYIQWLFPIPDTAGANPDAQPLHPHEMKAIRSDNKLTQRFLDAYVMMLDFYGMKLSKDTGEISRTKNWEERYEFLNRSVEDHRRITRIIKALDCFGFSNFQYAWVSFLINEIYVQKRLADIPSESVHMWISIMADDNDKVACAITLEELRDAEEEGVFLSDYEYKNIKVNKKDRSVSRKQAQKLKRTVHKTDERVSDNVNQQHDPEQAMKTLARI